MDIHYIKAESQNHFEDAKKIFELYQASLGFDLCFQGFQKELASLPQHYNDNDGGIFIAYDADKPVGTVALRRLQNDIGEVKRMYALPEYRGQKIGKTLMDLLVSLAQKLDYKLLRLDTLTHMESALKIYRANGFEEIQSYTHNPLDSVIYMEKKI
jgi:ribosomal protein S18 acetylase RimI-like enzyme